MLWTSASSSHYKYYRITTTAILYASRHCLYTTTASITVPLYDKSYITTVIVYLPHLQHQHCAFNTTDTTTTTTSIIISWQCLKIQRKFFNLLHYKILWLVLKSIHPVANLLCPPPHIHAYVYTFSNILACIHTHTCTYRHTHIYMHMNIWYK